MKLWIFALTLVAALVAGAHASFAQVVALGASNTEGHGVGSSSA
jgi:hypothetical protein